jgi:hypothetical protein
MSQLDLCLKAFGPEIFQQNFAVWLAMILGTLAFIAGLYLSIKTTSTRWDALSLVAFGIACVLVSLTGKVPFISGPIGSAEASTIDVEKTYKAGCYSLNDPEPAPPVSNSPTVTVAAIPASESPSEAIRSAKTNESFVWIFFANSRREHSDALAKFLQDEDITIETIEDNNFGLVRSRLKNGDSLKPGDARVIVSDSQSMALAKAISAILESEFDSKVTLIGPDPTVSRKPIQVLLF